jgi:hypothetical protein
MRFMTEGIISACLYKVTTYSKSAIQMTVDDHTQQLNTVYISNKMVFYQAKHNF